MNIEENIITKEEASIEKKTNISEETCTKEKTCGCGCENVCTGEIALKEEEKDIRNITEDIMKIFEDKDYAYPLTDVMDELEDLGYKNPGAIVTCALQDNLLYVDNIEPDGSVFIAISEECEDEE